MKKVIKGSSLIIWILTFTATGVFAQTEVPEYVEDIIIVDAEQLIEKAQQFETLVLIDSRITKDYSEGYIPGAINLTDEQTSCDSLAQIVEFKTQPILFYCNGPKCWRSFNAARIALSCGYQDVLWFRGGLAQWRDRQYAIEQQ